MSENTQNIIASVFLFTFILCVLPIALIMLCYEFIYRQITGVHSTWMQ